MTLFPPGAPQDPKPAGSTPDNTADNTAPQAAQPEAGQPQPPQYGPPQGPPQYGPTQAGPTQPGPTPYGAPQYGPPQAGPVPQYGEYAPQYHPAHYGQPQPGQPQSGQHQPGQPSLSQPYYGQPAYAPAVPPRKPRRGLAIGISITSITLVVLLVAGIAVSYLARQQLVDQLAVWGYETTPAIESYIERSTMTDRGAFLFKASEPEITSDADFNDSCGSNEEGAGILGCYLPTSGTILLYDVTDDRLDGIEEVVASHEMLHAAWDRMSESEQATLEVLLEDEAAKLADDDEFASRMDFYARAEPGERANELHSIIGTEIAKISPELEKHYAEYFSDRAALVALQVKSNAVFEENARQSDKLIATLDKLRKRVDKDYKTYKRGYNSLDDDIAAFNVRADNGSFATQAEFESARSALLSRQDDLDDLFDDIQDRIDKYDRTNEKLATLNAEAAKLNESINIAPLDGGLDSGG